MYWELLQIYSALHQYIYKAKKLQLCWEGFSEQTSRFISRRVLCNMTGKVCWLPNTLYTCGQSGCSVWWLLPLGFWRCLAEFWMAGRSCPSSCSTWAQSGLPCKQSQAGFPCGFTPENGCNHRTYSSSLQSELMFPSGFSTLQAIDQWRLLSFSPNYIHLGSLNTVSY